ncbi:MAG: hypothetical protein HZA90_03590 [Verrucomicrobia bacterium]|nr:hypothetical protein [Verrucomicrobiota bacterium]
MTEEVQNQNLSLVPAAPPAAVEVVSPVAPAGSRRLSKARLVAAFAIAGVSDALSLVFGLAMPVQWTIDLTTAALLFAVMGWRWALLPGLIMEAIPGVDMFPSWVLVVGAVAALGSARPKLN